MKPTLQLKLGQHLTMTPQLQQAIRLLQLSTLELQSEIQQALEENPMLEQEEDNTENTVDTKTQAEKQELENLSNANEKNAENDDPHMDMENQQDIPDELAVDANWEDTYDITTATAPSSQTNSQANSDSNNDFLENQSIEGDTLSEHLVWQLHNSQFSDTDHIIAIAIIDAINDDGYLTESVEEIFDGLKNELDIDLDEVEAVLRRVQHFDPVGIAARDLKECLLLQLEQFDSKTPGLADVTDIIQYHLDLLGAHDYARLQKKTRRDEEQLKKLITFIQALNPKPGDSISSNKAQYVTPDIFVRKFNGQWRVSLNPDASPNLRINAVYESHLKNAGRGNNTSHLRNSLQEARWFLKSLQSRSDTLQRVGKAIVERQRLFLDYGEEGMKPMVLRDIAEELEMHESTISRVTTNKFMHTPRGVFEFKFFFSSHVGTADGGECSATAIRSMVKKLIENENQKKPMSDNKISSLLIKEGINVARRTVAKYRESMLIPPSNERKRLT
ncbi:RNA polymerase sigma-54 factor RpoN [hydrothermal vent metagenome]|uniref:RNA polymerase sigma-54 factor RpoN n=1 Tax=hydrothermal vent metagenome TaxID=652676 RepID=A0A3B0W4I5_9ZZZZ